MYAKTEQGLKRLSDTRSRAPVQSSTNRGSAKGSEMEQARLIYVKTCDICRREFEAISTAKYCSNACRQRAKRARANCY